MVPTPTALGMWLCDQVIIEEKTKKPSLIGCFLGLPVEMFPSPPQRFSVFSALTDARGAGTIGVVATRLETDEVIYQDAHPISFPDRMIVVHVHLLLTRVIFSEPG